MDIQPIITNLTDVAGVSGAAIFDDAGHCLAHQLFPPYDPLLLWEMLRELRVTTDGYSGVGVGSHVTDSLLVFEHGKVLIRRAEPFELVALANDNANVAVLAVAFNVAMLRLHQSGNGWNGSVSSRGTSATGVPTYGSSRDWSGSYDVSAESEPSGIHRAYPPGSSYGSTSQQTQMSWSQTHSKATGAVGPKVMRHLLMVTQRYLGQDAQPLLERELRSLGATPQTLTSSQFADLIRGVARLLEREHRDHYVAEVLGDRSSR